MTKAADLRGKTFGTLKVIERVGSNKHGSAMWLCECSCGKTKAIIAHDLIAGKSKTCGHRFGTGCGYGNKIYLSGYKIGRLTVIEDVGRSSNGSVLWRCKCECGKEKVIASSNLMNGTIKSCGCYKHEVVSRRMKIHGLSKTKEYVVAIANRRRELKKKLDSSWSATMGIELKKFFPVCVACGGTDRMSKDHVLPLSRGYGLKPGNAVILCVHCNASKRSKSLDRLPEEKRNRILRAAHEFKIYWDSISQTKTP